MKYMSAMARCLIEDEKRIWIFKDHRKMGAGKKYSACMIVICIKNVGCLSTFLSEENSN